MVRWRSQRRRPPKLHPHPINTMFKARIHVRLRPSILDPQGKTTHHALEDLGFDSVKRVRMGKLIEIWIEADDEEAARRVATEACQKLLANPVIEDYEIFLEAVEESTVVL